MNNYRYSYAVEKLTTAMECLATDSGDVRERLISAHLIFHTLRDESFPPQLRKKWKWINKELTKFGPLLDYKGEPYRGSVENTMKRIRKSTGSKIAKIISEIYWEISENQQYK